MNIHFMFLKGVGMRDSCRTCVITSKRMKIVDQNAEYYGLPSRVLMESAGKSIAEEVRRRLKKLDGVNVVVVAGLGNNGGDGLVAARYLANFGANVSVILLGDPGKIKTDEARTNWKLLELMRFCVKLFKASSKSEIAPYADLIRDADVIIDAVFGTGIRGEIREPYSTAIDLINESKGLKVSVDVPSGLDPDLGTTANKVVRADLTITMHRVKRGLLGRSEVGELVVADIGIPKEIEESIGPGDLRNMLGSSQNETFNIKVGVLSSEVEKAFLISQILVSLGSTSVILAPRRVLKVLKKLSPESEVEPLPKAEELRDKLREFDIILVDLHDENIITEVADELSRFFLVLNDPGGSLLRSLPVGPRADVIAVLSAKKLGVDRDDVKEALNATLDVTKRRGVTILVGSHFDIVTDGKELRVNWHDRVMSLSQALCTAISAIASSFLCKSSNLMEVAAASVFLSWISWREAASKLGTTRADLAVPFFIPQVLSKLELRSRTTSA